MTEKKPRSPQRSLRITLQVITAVILFVYPFAVYFGLNYAGIQAIAPILLLFFILRLVLARGKIKALSWLIKTVAFIGIVLASASWILQQSQWLLYYPVVVNAVLLLLFAASLYRPPPIIERLARLTEPDLPEAGVRYTRKVTQVWCLFFFLNGTFALYTCLSGNIALWTLYNGAISYLLIGALMAIEWIIRKRIRR
jgi:uncharacterized membrane protein